MKTKKVVLFMLCLIFTCFSTKISAQSHLDALIKKCETHKSVDMEVVKSKKENDKDIETKRVNIRITNDKKLVSEFLDAFKKDAVNAEQVMIRKKKESSEINYYQCRFPKQIYTIIVKESGNANVTVSNPLKFQFRKFSADSLSLWQNRQKERVKQYKNRIKQYKLQDLDSILLKHDVIADSLILKSKFHFNSINWDSITSKFGKDIDSTINQLGIDWDEVWRYKFE